MAKLDKSLLSFSISTVRSLVRNVGVNRFVMEDGLSQHPPMVIISSLMGYENRSARISPKVIVKHKTTGYFGVSDYSTQLSPHRVVGVQMSVIEDDRRAVSALISYHLKK